MEHETLVLANAYTDSQRLGYSEPGKVLWDTDLAPSPTQVGAVFAYKEGRIGLEPGKKYTFTIDSVTHEFECAVYEGLPHIGDEAAGIFCEEIGDDIDGWITQIAVYSGGAHATISTAETIHTIDPKYLPPSAGGGLPVIELTTVLDGSGEYVVLTDEEGAQLNAAMEQGMPIVIKGMLNNGADAMALAGVFMLFPMGKAMAYITSIMDVTVAFITNGEVWQAGIMPA